MNMLRKFSKYVFLKAKYIKAHQRLSNNCCSLAASFHLCSFGKIQVKTFIPLNTILSTLSSFRTKLSWFLFILYHTRTILHFQNQAFSFPCFRTEIGLRVRDIGLCPHDSIVMSPAISLVGILPLYSPFVHTNRSVFLLISDQTQGKLGQAGHRVEMFGFNSGVWLLGNEMKRV